MNNAKTLKWKQIVLVSPPIAFKLHYSEVFGYKIQTQHFIDIDHAMSQCRNVQILLQPMTKYCRIQAACSSMHCFKHCNKKKKEKLVSLFYKNYIEQLEENFLFLKAVEQYLV